MKLPLLIDAMPAPSKRGPEVLLGVGNWRIESNTDSFVLHISPLVSPHLKVQVSNNKLDLKELHLVQAELTNGFKERVSIFAVRE